MAKKKVQSNNLAEIIDLECLSRDEKINLLERLNELDNRLKYNKLTQIFPDQGPYSRSQYPKQMAFMAAGARHKERALFGGNRTGKSFVAAAEVTYHLTGLYPHWWTGKRFYGPIQAVCLGRSHSAVRDVAQFLLCGSVYDIGTGMIPKHCFIAKGTRAKQGIPNAFSEIMVKHYTNGVEDGVSVCYFMSYEAGADVLQGTTREVAWEDEENPDPEIHSELVTRTATVNGISLLTFTPRKGLSDIVKSFLPTGRFPENNISLVETPYGAVERFIQRIEWDDVPHLDEKTKAEMLASYLPHEVEARSKGYPVVGKGKVYPFSLNDILVEPFKIPFHWKRCYALDPGWVSTACLWAAIDPDTDTVYLYDEYKSGEQLRQIHTYAIQSRGAWIPGVIDPASKRHNEDGKASYQEYKKLGLNIRFAENPVDAGLMKVSNAFAKGKLKIMNHLMATISEFNIYSFGDDGKPAPKQDDHLMDCLRYIYNSGLRIAEASEDDLAQYKKQVTRQKAFKTRDRITGC